MVKYNTIQYYAFSLSGLNFKSGVGHSGKNAYEKTGFPNRGTEQPTDNNVVNRNNSSGSLRRVTLLIACVMMTLSVCAICSSGPNVHLFINLPPDILIGMVCFCVFEYPN